MPRPQRIQYENAFYHVINGGRGRQAVFPADVYCRSFLNTLEEAYSRFDAVVHAYCLLGSHYHLLMETPRANLDRIMRHINGVYTQRYNRLKKTDGALFRGRYQAILVDQDAYLLQLGRYIHRNPVDTTPPLATDLAAYPWSSYPAYINQAESPSWLHRDKTYGVLGRRQKYIAYQVYVNEGVDDETQRFYSRGNIASVMGDAGFRKGVVANKEKLKANVEAAHILSERPAAKAIIAAVANVFHVEAGDITARKQGRQQANFPRKLAIYVCQQYGDLPLKSIAELFGLTHTGSVSSAIKDVKQRIDEGHLHKTLEQLKKGLNIIQ
ncbi:MAG: transposase [Cellvibrionaceae bacterium]|nr:transposase [Cellvibrionaceae bacterium]